MREMRTFSGMALARDAACVLVVVLLSLGPLPGVNGQFKPKYGYPCTSYAPDIEGDAPCSPGGSPYTVYPNKLTWLTLKYNLSVSYNYGWWFNWNCKQSQFGHPIEKCETYLMACQPPIPTPKGWTKNKDCYSDTTCPGEPGCLGIQCFGSQWLSSVGYDGLMKAYAQCCNNFSACTPWWRKWLKPPTKFQGPKLKGSLACPEPPYKAGRKFWVWVTEKDWQ